MSSLSFVGYYYEGLELEEVEGRIKDVITVENVSVSISEHDLQDMENYEGFSCELSCDDELDHHRRGELKLDLSLVDGDIVILGLDSLGNQPISPGGSGGSASAPAKPVIVDPLTQMRPVFDWSNKGMLMEMRGLGDYQTYLRDQRDKIAAANPDYWNDLFSHQAIDGTNAYICIAQEDGETKTARINSLGTLMVALHVVQDGRIIGECNYMVVPDEVGALESRLAHIDFRQNRMPGYVKPGQADLDITSNLGKEDYTNTGRGLGRTVTEALFAASQAGGVSRVSTHAVGAGSYAWARSGFEFDPREKLVLEARDMVARRMANKFADYVTTTPSAAPFVAEFNRQLEAGTLPTTPYGLAQLGSQFQAVDTRSGRQMPLGQYAIMSSDWHGVRRFT